MQLQELWVFSLKKERAVTQRSPVFINDYILMVFNYGQGRYQGDLVAANAKTGEEVWRFSRDHYLNEPCISNDNCILVSCLDGSVYKLDLDGSIQWETCFSDCNVWSGQVLGGVFIYPEIHGRSKYTRGLRISDGSLLWEYASGGHTNHISCTSDGKAIFSSSLSSTRFGDNTCHLQCIDGKSGAQDWRIEYSKHLHKPIVINDYVLLASKGSVMLFSLKNGKLLDELEFDDEVVFSAKPIETAEGIVFVSENGRCLCLTISEHKPWLLGKRKARFLSKWHCDLRGSIKAQVAVSKDRVYIIDETGHLNSVSVQSGEVLSRFKIPSFKTGHAVALSKDILYLSTSRNCTAYQIT